jgi:hypothetical protein
MVMQVKPIQRVVETMDQALDLVQEAKIDPREFEKSDHSLEDFVKEGQEKEVNFFLYPATDIEPPFIGRVALTAAIHIYAPWYRLQWLQTGIILRKKVLPYNKRDITVTETCRRGKAERSEAARCLKDELGLEIDENLLFVDGRPYFPDPHQSSVYPKGIVTIAKLQRFELALNEPPWTEEWKLARDTSKLVVIEPFRFPTEPAK